MSHFGYIMKAARAGHYKVGITGNIRRRYSTYGTHSHDAMRVVFLGVFQSVQDASLWESSVLRKYASDSIRGEWLRSRCGLTSEVKSAVVCGVSCAPIPQLSPKRSPGRPKVLLRCPLCREKFGTWDLQRHIPHCPKKVVQPGQTEATS